MAELEEGLGSGELKEWMEYHDLEPFGSWINGFYHSQLATLIANIKRDPKKRPQAYNLNDYMYKTPKQAKEQETKRVLLSMDAMAKKGNK